MTRSMVIKDGPEMCEASHKPKTEISNLNGDWINIFVLIILYIIQGIPIGLSSVFPFILQKKPMISYTDLAAFSVALWPFTIKLLWAPIVDALYVKFIGRRKSWLMPLQLVMGSILIVMAINIDNWLPEKEKPNLNMIVLMTFILNFLSATQDIVVDGWSLTMLKKRNVRYSSTANYVGILIGIFIGSTGCTLLISEEFNIKYFRSTPGSGAITSMKNFLFCWAICVLSVTTLTGLFKKEKDDYEHEYENISVFRGYKLLGDILKLPRIRILAIALLTTRFGFTATESVSSLKLMEVGVSQDNIMIIRSIMTIFQIIAPMFISKYISNPKPMTWFLRMMPIRLLWGYVFTLLFWLTPSFVIKNDKNIDLPTFYYIILGFINLINEAMNLVMMITIGAFFCQMSDPRLGGTYMTLFNTFYFMGWLIPNTFVLTMVDGFTFGQCSTDIHNTCSTKDLSKLCKNNGGVCDISVDGFYVCMVICTSVGFVWYCVFKNILKNYQSLSVTHWMVKGKQLNTEEVKDPCIISST